MKRNAVSVVPTIFPRVVAAMHADGLTFKDMAPALKMHRNRVAKYVRTLGCLPDLPPGRGKAAELRLAVCPVPAVFPRVLAGHVARGYTAGQVAKSLGMERNRLTDVARGYGVIFKRAVPGRPHSEAAKKASRRVAECRMAAARERHAALARSYACPDWFLPRHLAVILALLDGPAAKADLPGVDFLQRRWPKKTFTYRNVLTELRAAGYVASYTAPPTVPGGFGRVMNVLTLKALTMIAAAEPAEESAP